MQIPTQAHPAIAEQLPVSEAWAGHPVNFALVTRESRQLVAFYAADRRLTIGSRALDQRSGTS